MLTKENSLFRLTKIHDYDVDVIIKPVLQISPYHYVSSSGYIYNIGAKFNKNYFFVRGVYGTDSGLVDTQILNRDDSHWNYILDQRTQAWSYYSD